ncbi:MAG: EFR1 family ferrodoxin [Bacteroidales bacterium]|jgi:ferredoxin|nr:EFR1 family ferrodoxin [Bacteroidales bacterium]MDD2205134.1 EFR1 family ferrodoxin [Bacteroidales bacterium]MDD3151482.1 EFR1 family ferrodoxin [Bacteroidales bacterium]MDD3914895.1 EFR1 family ferrodoxin [Bacteroidales bacterium]MDD4634680.1 EFR1 family ferrodoxin [Bacteroidales bacterium]
MIFYFTGVGNSKWIAELLSKKLNEPVVSINDIIKSEVKSYEYTAKADERILLVFPIYSWGLPSPVCMFIERLQLSDFEDKKIYAVATCGNYAGLANKMLKDKLQERNLQLASFHTVAMPNCYITMKGFDIDSAEVAKEKINHAEARVDLIVNAIIEDRQDDTLYSKGSLAWLKTKIIYPSFMKYSNKTEFYATEACNHCGLCVKLCPMNNIVLKDGVPVWSEKCVQCLACIHRCPQRAIEYGKITQKKGRYYFKKEDGA